VYSIIDEVKTSFERRKLSFFIYILCVVAAIYATYRGYSALPDVASAGIFESAASFVAASIYYYLVAAVLGWAGKAVARRKMSDRKAVAFIIFAFAVSLVVYNAVALIIQPDLSFMNFLISIVIGFALLFVALGIELKR